MKYYKLTDQNMQTYNGFQWTLMKWEEAPGNSSQPLCLDGWLHCYDSPLLAVLHNPIHADIYNPRLFEVEVSGGTKDDNGMKRGFRKMRLIKEILLPIVTQEQRITYGILCVKSVYADSKFIVWADRWLSGEDRSELVARSIARSAAESAARSVARSAAELVARSVARSTQWQCSRSAARSAWAVSAAVSAAVSSAVSAWAVSNKRISLVEFAEQAISK